MKNGKVLCLGGTKVVMVFSLEENPLAPSETQLMQTETQVEAMQAHNSDILMVGQVMSYVQIINFKGEEGVRVEQIPIMEALMKCHIYSMIKTGDASLYSYLTEKGIYKVKMSAKFNQNKLDNIIKSERNQ